MNKKKLSERDICTKFITPALVVAGWDVQLSYGPADRVDLVATNPPFGGMEEDGIESNFPATFRTRDTADLFLVLIMHLLKDGVPFSIPSL